MFGEASVRKGPQYRQRAKDLFPYLSAALPAIETHRLSRLHLEGPAGRGTDITSDGPAALMIRRMEFDHLLVRLALDAGVELIEDVEITQATEQDASVQLVSPRGRRELSIISRNASKRTSRTSGRRSPRRWRR